MTIATTSNREDYIGNNTTDTYDFNYKIFSETDLVVTTRDTDDVETTLALTTDYTVEFSGNSGTITLVAGNLATDIVLTIKRIRDINQETDIRNQGSYYPETIEDAFDHFIMIAQQHQDIIERSVQLPPTIQLSQFDPTLPSTILSSLNCTIVVNATGDGWSIGPTVGEISSAAAYAAAASASATLASQWATLTSGIVASTDYSSKAWAIGGTGVTNTASRGASKEWATKTSGTVDTSEFSSKEYAQGTQSSTGGSSKSWATQATIVDSVDYSSKSYAISSGVITAGSAKEWATKTTGAVDTTFSAKEYAQGSQASTGGSAKNWAQQTGADVTGAAANSRSAKSWAQEDNTGATLGGSSKDWAQTTGSTVDGSEYSSKEWAVGITVTSGSSKDWAVKTSGTVIASNYSSKEWAIGTQTRGAASGGSSKDWATYTGGSVDDSGFSSKQWATKATTTVDGTYYSAYQYALNAAASAATITAYYTPGTQTPANGGQITITSAKRQVIKVSGSGGAVTLSTTPFSGSPTDGMEIVIQGLDDTNTVTFSYNDAADGCLLNGTFTLGKAYVLILMYCSTLSRWVELSRNH